MSTPKLMMWDLVEAIAICRELEQLAQTSSNRRIDFFILC